MAGKVKAVNEFGLDKELAERAAAKYDVKLEQEAQVWIEAVTGITFDQVCSHSLSRFHMFC